MQKCISVLLALILTLSCLSAGTCALAATDDDVTSALDAFDLDALKEASGVTVMSDAANYPAETLAALDAAVNDWRALSQEEINAIDLTAYLKLVDLLYWAKLWTDWDAMGRPTDMMSTFMLYLTWQSDSNRKYDLAADQLGLVPEVRENPIVRAHEANRLGLNASKTNAATAIATTLYQILRTPDGKALADALFAGVEVPVFAQQIVDKVRDTLTQRDGLKKIIAMLDSPVAGIAVALITIIKMLLSLKNFFAGLLPIK